jgi:hypothetical protein
MFSSQHPQRIGQQAETGKKIKNYLYQYADKIGHGNFAKVYKGINMSTSTFASI